MEDQLKWLMELLNKKPKRFEEYFYIDVLNFFNLDLEEIDINDLYDICGPYTDKLLNCKRKKEVKKWLFKISTNIISNLEVEIIIDEFFYKIRNGEIDINS